MIARREQAAEPVFRFDSRYLDRPMTLGRFVLEQLRDCCFSGLQSSQGEKTKALTLLYVLSGEGSLVWEEEQADVSERSFVLCPPGQSWNMVSKGSEPIRLLTVTFRVAAMRGNAFEELNRQAAVSVFHDTGGGLETSLFDLLKEAGETDMFSREMAEACMSRIAVSLCRFRQAGAPVDQAQPGAVTPGDKPQLVYETVRYIDLRLAEIRELGEIAEALGYSYSHLSHVFRVEMGMSLQTYWNRKRILRAMTFLQSGGTSITRIAETLHYQSVHSFSKAFKKIAGLSPTEYQELYGRQAGD